VSSSELLRVHGLTSEWDGTPVLEGVSFAVAEGEFVVLMGPNGSGKTTLLRAIAGLDRVRSGEIVLRGRSLEGVPPHRRGVGLLSQDPALLPGRTVWENIAYGLEVARAPASETERRVSEMVDLLHLEGLEDRAPTALSGGERQRTALARTLAPRPALVLLDEPFASVDAELRTELMSEFREVLRRLDTAALHVTHDREEGLFLGDRVLLLDRGRLEQAGPPAEVFGSPATSSVARFLGYNVFRTPSGFVAVHPAAVRFAEPGRGRFDATVVATGLVGRDRMVHLRLENGDRCEARAPVGVPAPVPTGRVAVDWRESIELER